MSTNFDLLVAAAKAVPIEDEAGARGITIRGRSYAGPCPLCGGRDRFWIDVPKQIWGCRQHGVGGDVIELVKFLDDCDFVEAVRKIAGDEERPRIVQREPVDATDKEKLSADQIRKANWLWEQRRPAAGSIAETYLREVRGIIDPIPASIGFLPKIRDGYHPAMITRFGPPTAIVTAVHLTFLKPDGLGKDEITGPDGSTRTKIIVGRTTLPIFLSDIPEAGAIDVTEGIEDGLSVVREGRGVLVAGTANRLPYVSGVVPRRTREVVIWAHPDKDGQRKSRELATTLYNEKFIPTRVELI